MYQEYIKFNCTNNINSQDHSGYEYNRNREHSRKGNTQSHYHRKGREEKKQDLYYVGHLVMKAKLFAKV